MNLIKLNPLKKLMLVVLSWFVHAVYHVEVHAWHIGNKIDYVTNESNFIYAQYNGGAGGDYALCGTMGDGNDYYIFPPNPSLSGVFYVYYPATNKYSSVPTSGVLCLTPQEFKDMQTFFGNVNSNGSVNQNWGKCMAINCCNGSRVSCAVAATCGDVLVSGQMFPVLLASDSTMTRGSGFSSAYSQAYAAAKVLIPNSGGDYTMSCTLRPKGYVASTDASGAISAVFKSCPAGYYCPGGSSIGVGMGKLTLNAGRVACSAGYYCPAATTVGKICSKGYYAGPGRSSCTRCESRGGVYGTTLTSGTAGATACFISGGAMMSVDGHSFAFINNCYYS